MKKCLFIKSLLHWTDIKSNKLGSKNILLLKVSSLSTVSFVAEKFVDMWADGIHEAEVECFKIDVINSKEVSDVVSVEFGIKHESPQLIWIKPDGEIGWHGHHHEISLERLNILTLQMKNIEKER